MITEDPRICPECDHRNTQDSGTYNYATALNPVPKLNHADCWPGKPVWAIVSRSDSLNTVQFCIQSARMQTKRTPSCCCDLAPGGVRPLEAKPEDKF